MSMAWVKKKERQGRNKQEEEEERQKNEEEGKKVEEGSCKMQESSALELTRCECLLDQMHAFNKLNTVHSRTRPQTILLRSGTCLEG